MPSSLKASYPNMAYFVDAIGWIEIGHDDDSPLTSFIKAFDPGGMVWEGKDSYTTLDEAFQDLDAGLGDWMSEHGIR